jgi:hypothetical protein
MLTINIERTQAGGYSIRLRSDERDDFYSAIQSLKSYVDASCRSFDPQTKKWHVDEVAEDCMHDWLGYCTITLGAQIEWFGARRSEQNSSSSRRCSRLAKLFALRPTRLLPSSRLRIERWLNFIIQTPAAQRK